MPKRPAVTIENYKAIYDYYGDPAYMGRYDGKRRLATHLVHNAIGHLLSPRLTYGEGAPERVADMVDRDVPAAVFINHVSLRDPNVVQAAVHLNPDLRRRMKASNLWTVTKDSLFRVPVPGFRTYLDSRNLIPAYRPKSYASDETRSLLFPAIARLEETLVTHLQAGHTVAMFPEGERNLGDPTQIMRQKVGPPAAKVVLGALGSGVDEVDLVSIGVYYGPDNHTRHASVHLTHQPSDALPGTVPALKTFIRENMQLALDGAVQNY